MILSTNNRITQLFEQQHIADDDRVFWLARLEQAPDSVSDCVVRMFEQYPSHIVWFRIMQDKKEIALARDDDATWGKIIEEEKQYLSSAVVTPQF